MEGRKEVGVSDWYVDEGSFHSKSASFNSFVIECCVRRSLIQFK